MSQSLSVGDPVKSETLGLRRMRRARFGANIHPRRVTQTVVSAQELGESINLELPPDWTIRDQGETGACVAYAAVACVEYFVYQRTKNLSSLSEQFVYTKMKELQRRRNIKSDRTWLSEAAEVLRGDGVCLESHCPYDLSFAATGAIVNSPSREAEVEAKKHRFNATVIGDPEDHRNSPAEYIVRSLRDGKPAAISIPVQVLLASPDGLLNWTTRLARFHGIVADPTADCDDGHAVCLVGYRNDRRADGGGWFVCRNSWGSEWSSETPSSQPFAIQGLPGRGYGVVSVGYVEQYCSEIMTITGQV